MATRKFKPRFDAVAVGSPRNDVRAARRSRLVFLQRCFARSVSASGDDRDPISHRCGKPCTFSSNIANSATTPVTRRISLSVSRQEETGNRRHAPKKVAASIRMKVADDSKLRAQRRRRTGRADREHDPRHSASVLNHGGKLILFGNGGSATDANDWALDCVLPPAGYHAIPAVSLSLEPANITALANDIGTEVDFSAPIDRTGAAGR